MSSYCRKVRDSNKIFKKQRHVLPNTATKQQDGLFIFKPLSSNILLMVKQRFRIVFLNTKILICKIALLESFFVGG